MKFCPLSGDPISISLTPVNSTPPALQQSAEGTLPTSRIQISSREGLCALQQLMNQLIINFEQLSGLMECTIQYEHQEEL